MSNGGTCVDGIVYFPCVFPLAAKILHAIRDIRFQEKIPINFSAQIITCRVLCIISTVRLPFK